jgi:hypothetical protein
VVKIWMFLFWVLTPCGFVGKHQCFRETQSPSSGLKMEAVFLWNVDMYLQVHTALQLRRPTRTQPVLWTQWSGRSVKPHAYVLGMYIVLWFTSSISVILMSLSFRRYFLQNRRNFIWISQALHESLLLANFQLFASFNLHLASIIVTSVVCLF